MKFWLASLVLVVLAVRVNAAEPAPKTSKYGDSIDQAIANDTLGEEPPPPPEYPYPGATEEGFATPSINPPSTTNQTTTSPSASTKTAPPSEAPSPAVPSPKSKGLDITTVPKPLSIDADGTYNYGTYDDDAKQTSPQKTVQPPPKPAAPPPPKPKFDKNKVPKPLSIDPDGTYNYGTYDDGKKSYNHSASMRIGFFGPPRIVNPLNGQFFSNIYGASDIPTFFFDYEYKLTQSFGDLGLKIGSGIFVASGNGRFADKSRVGEETREKFTFLMFPNTLGAIYRLAWFKNQYVVPYAEGGLGFFTFMETRDDGMGPKFGGAATTYGALGLSFLLDWMDPASMRELDREYGVNHVYLNLDYREFLGLNKEFDFSSRVIGGGFAIDF